MATENSNNAKKLETKDTKALTNLLWGINIKDEIFRRWTQGFTFSPDESTALLQMEGGPCAVIVPTQAFLLKHLIFNENTDNEEWRQISGKPRDDALLIAISEIFMQLDAHNSHFLLLTRTTEHTNDSGPSCSTTTERDVDEESVEVDVKRACYSHERFHASLLCTDFENIDTLKEALAKNMDQFKNEYGVLLLLYSIILSKGIERIKNEMEDCSEALIDPVHGHGSQSLINMLLTGKALPHVFDGVKDISGLKLQGVSKRSTVGFLTYLEYLRYLEVGWFMKNPEYPMWLLGSETHLTLLFSQDMALVSNAESDGVKAQRVFTSFDADGSGFVSVDILGDVMRELNLESEPSYVKMIAEKLDPEELGIVTLSSFLGEFYPTDFTQQSFTSHVIYHYNGLSRSHTNNKVKYAKGTAILKDDIETQFITDSFPITHCMMTKWPTLELNWQDNHTPSLN